MAISLIYGPSGSGKTYRLVRTYILAGRYNLTAIVIKPRLYDARFNTREILYENDIKITENVYILGEDRIPQDVHYDFILVENTQFMSIPEIHTILDTYAVLSNNVVFYGTPQDYAGVPFPAVKYLLDNKNELLDVTEELTAKCYACKKPGATLTQRLINGVPATITPEIFIEPFVKHVPACEQCYTSPEEILGLTGGKTNE